MNRHQRVLLLVFLALVVLALSVRQDARLDLLSATASAQEGAASEVGEAPSETDAAVEGTEQKAATTAAARKIAPMAESARRAVFFLLFLCAVVIAACMTLILSGKSAKAKAGPRLPA